MGRKIQNLTDVEQPNVTVRPACAITYPIQVRVSAAHRKLLETIVTGERQHDRKVTMTSVIEKALESYAKTQTMTP